MADTVAGHMIAKFGGQSNLARALGIKQSTVSHWAKTGTVPVRWHSKIIQAAADQGLDVTAGDLVSTPTVMAVRPTKVPVALTGAVLTVGDEDETAAVHCYILNDGRRVISRTSALAALAMSDERVVGGDLQRYVKPVGVYLRTNLDDEFVEFVLDNVANKKVFGITAECFLDICRAFVRAYNADKLVNGSVYHYMARKASAFLAACANVGLIALIDEATGYQYMRPEDALRTKLTAYLGEMRKWEKTFPDELWIEFGRLTNWKGNVQNRPKYWGNLVNELIYNYLDPDVFQWLKANAPAPRHGRNYHQWLTDQYGLKKLVEHIWRIIGMASMCSNMTELKMRTAMQFGKQPVQLMFFIDPPKTLPEA